MNWTEKLCSYCKNICKEYRLKELDPDVIIIHKEGENFFISIRTSEYDEYGSCKWQRIEIDNKLNIELTNFWNRCCEKLK
ncbi:MAG TPA: hypothetical protein VJM74_02210 [Nitrososphaeraceae archaeon]|nr:hypothetical protein [Nitrososphaeraceae archaeon]